MSELSRKMSITALKSVKRLSQRELIVEFFKNRGDHGATSDEAEVAFTEFAAVDARVSELRKSHGLLIENGETRLTRYGRPAAVLVYKKK